MRRLVFNKAGDEDSTVWEAGYFNDRDRAFHEMFDRHLDDLLTAFVHGDEPPIPRSGWPAGVAARPCVDRVIRVWPASSDPLTSSLASNIDWVARQYRELHNSAPSGIWKIPGRVNVIGEHTDYNHGYVLPFAIDKAVVAAASIRPDGRFSITSRQLGHEEFDVTELVGGASLRYAAAAVWAAP